MCVCGVVVCGGVVLRCVGVVYVCVQCTAVRVLVSSWGGAGASCAGRGCYVC